MTKIRLSEATISELMAIASRYDRWGASHKDLLDCGLICNEFGITMPTEEGRRLVGLIFSVVNSLESVDDMIRAEEYFRE